MPALTLNPQALIQGVRALPPLPKVVREMLALMNNDDRSEQRFLDLLSLDPALSANALRLANSSFYGRNRQIMSISEALRVLGQRSMGTLVMAAGTNQLLPVSDQLDWDINAFWRHAIGTALTAQGLARLMHVASEVAYTAGLLHDIGQLAVAHLSPASVQAVRAHQLRWDSPTLDAERAVLGVDHAELGALLIAQWQLPVTMVDAICAHHEPDLLDGHGLIGLTHMADAISHALGLSGLADEAVPHTPPGIWAALAPKQDACLQLFADVEQQFARQCAQID
jgi:putative nucleotidyltransferase with HDIG domain